MKLESLLQYLDAYLGIPAHPDYPMALNGLQVGGPDDVSRVVAAVDASEAAILAAVERGADLLLVHHGLFWDGLQPVTGRRLRRLRPLLEHGVALYSAHLPLDGHPEVGNCALLGRALGLDLQGRFAAYGGVEIGWWGELPTPLEVSELARRLTDALDGEGSHHTHFDAMELGVHVLMGGHYATETFGVRALAAHLAERFGLEWEFVDQPTGL
jgi:putative NIF3 family GTP cyclohydrolase 1 type 2